MKVNTQTPSKKVRHWTPLPSRGITKKNFANDHTKQLQLVVVGLQLQWLSRPITPQLWTSKHGWSKSPALSGQNPTCFCPPAPGPMKKKTTLEAPTMKSVSSSAVSGEKKFGISTLKKAEVYGTIISEAPFWDNVRQTSTAIWGRSSENGWKRMKENSTVGETPVNNGITYISTHLSTGKLDFFHSALSVPISNLHAYGLLLHFSS